MVRIQDSKGPDDADRLDQAVAEAAVRHGLRLDVEGWARKTYDLYVGSVRNRDQKLVARVESFAITDGVIRVYDERGLAFAQEVGEVLEREFGVAEAVIRRE